MQLSNTCTAFRLSTFLHPYKTILHEKSGLYFIFVHDTDVAY